MDLIKPETNFPVYLHLLGGGFSTMEKYSMCEMMWSPELCIFV